MKAETNKVTTSILEFDPTQYGLTESKAREIESTFSPMLNRMVELESEFNDLIVMEVDSKTCLLARELRLKYVNVRTGTAAIHKELKAFYLSGGRFIDGWKNAQAFSSQGIEGKLFDIEKHFEIVEKERITRIQESRSSILTKYNIGYTPSDLGTMPAEIWDNFLVGTKANHKAREAAEKKAAADRKKATADRIIKEEAEAAERARIELENIHLKKQAEERELKAKIEAEKQAKSEAERAAKQKKAEAERIEKESAERKIREEKERKERAAYESQLRVEREAREKIEAELRAKEAAEEKVRFEAERKAVRETIAKEKAQKAARMAPDKEKLIKFAYDILEIEFPDVQSAEALDMVKKTRKELDLIALTLQNFAL